MRDPLWRSPAGVMEVHYMNWMTTLRICALALGLIVFGSVSHADENADANRLFVNALRTIKYAETLGISSRAKAYGEANEAFQEIFEAYSGSDITVKLAAEQSIGSFEYQEFLDEFWFISPCIDLYSDKCLIVIFNYSLLFVEKLRTLPKKHEYFVLLRQLKRNLDL